MDSTSDTVSKSSSSTPPSLPATVKELNKGINRYKQISNMKIEERLEALKTHKADDTLLGNVAAIFASKMKELDSTDNKELKKSLKELHSLIKPLSKYIETNTPKFSDATKVTELHQTLEALGQKIDDIRAQNIKSKSLESQLTKLDTSRTFVSASLLTQHINPTEDIQLNTLNNAIKNKVSDMRKLQTEQKVFKSKARKNAIIAGVTAGCAVVGITALAIIFPPAAVIGVIFIALVGSIPLFAVALKTLGFSNEEKEKAIEKSIKLNETSSSIKELESYKKDVENPDFTEFLKKLPVNEQKLSNEGYVLDLHKLFQLQQSPTNITDAEIKEFKRLQESLKTY